MVVLGSLLALVCGVANSAAAALEKQEGRCVRPGVGGMALLTRLACRPRWLLAMALSGLAWTAEAGALTLAPVPLVTTLRGGGRGVLVAAGRRWLDERFRPVELVALSLAWAGGLVTALGVTSGEVRRAPLSVGDQLAVVGVTAAVALAMSRGPGRASGVGAGAAVGVLFVATGVFTKVIGDSVAREGTGAVVPVLTMPGLWSMPGLTVWAQSLLQQAFRRANAASVAAANAAVSSVGLVAAGFTLFGEPMPQGWRALALSAGVAISVTGTALLAAVSGRGRSEGPAPKLGPESEAAHAE